MRGDRIEPFIHGNTIMAKIVMYKMICIIYHNMSYSHTIKEEGNILPCGNDTYTICIISTLIMLLVFIHNLIDECY